jgi:hypothetical protein
MKERFEACDFVNHFVFKYLHCDFHKVLFAGQQDRNEGKVCHFAFSETSVISTSLQRVDISIHP